MSCEIRQIEQESVSEISLPKKIGYAVCGGWIAMGVTLAAAEFMSQTVEYAEDLAKFVH